MDRLPNNRPVSDLILGTVQFGLDYGINNKSGKPRKDQVFRILDSAYSAGIRCLDSADAYGDAYSVIGEYHLASGNYFNINTKFHPSKGLSVEANIRSSLDKLNVNSIGSYFFHNYSEYKSQPSALKNLQHIKQAGLIKEIGISVYSNEEISKILRSDEVDVIQMPFNVLDNYSLRKEMMLRMKEKGIRVQVRSVFLQGLVFMESGKIQPGLATFIPYLEKLNKIASGAGLTMEQLCLGYVASQSGIDEILVGVDSEEQLSSNLNSLNGKITPGIIHEIENICFHQPELLYPYNWK